MTDKFWYFVMVPMVYLSLAWFVVWIIVRIVTVLRAPNIPRTLRIFPDDSGPNDVPASPLAGAFWDAFTMPTIRQHQPVFWVFLLIFHISMMVLVLAHLDVLPQINIMSAKSEHMIGNGAVGVLVTVSLVYLMFRRFISPVREVSVAADYLILFVLLCTAVTGGVISWGNSWTESGFVMTKQDFGLYMDSVIKFTFADPRQFLSGGHYAVIGTHVLLANLVFILFPFSKMMHMVFAVPLNKLRRG
ncbi:MAG: respiratory nitrate reductase subunit gamma [Deltaproteobacteria bacterium]|nr:respiratory nitrate reductase subunit gamma [Deltaproteobacteria bacterium]